MWPCPSLRVEPARARSRERVESGKRAAPTAPLGGTGSSGLLLALSHMRFTLSLRATAPCAVQLVAAR